MELDTNNHSVFMLNYHLIMCVKYRNNVINDAISLRLKEIFKNICLNYNISLEEWNHDKDHVHIPVSYTHLKLIGMSFYKEIKV